MKSLNFIVTVGILQGISVILAEVNVHEEINRLESHLEKMKPPPELIGSILEQFQQHCKSSRKVDEALLTNMSKCVEKYMNETQLITDIKKAVPEGQLDMVFHDTCLKWPKVKACMSEVFEIIDECWDRGDKVNKIVDEGIKFFCGDDNDGARIALFLAEGGMECLEKHGDHVKTCVEGKHDLPDVADGIPELPANLVPKKDDICQALNSLEECTSKELRHCKDPTPENLATSMIKYVAKAVECKVIERPMSNRSAGKSFSQSGSIGMIPGGFELLTVVAVGSALFV
jgi:hypothetical protein